VVNIRDSEVAASVQLKGFIPTKPVASIIELAGPLTASNTATEPDTIAPKESELRFKDSESTQYTFPPRSFTVIRFE
jgi:alpha-L-arabinofuranosidase